MKKHRMFSAFAVIMVAGLIVAACGGADPTATPQPTSTPRPTATPVPAPAPGPQPVLMPAAQKLGGTLQLPVLASQPYGFDVFENGGPALAGEEIWQSVLNNLVVPDSYAQGSPLAGDTVENWEISSDGREMTFFLRPGIRYHDGDDFNADDVVYNIDRAWKPRSNLMSFFKVPFSVISSVEKVDNLTVRVTLSEPSNSLLGVMGRNVFLMYPSHVPFPEQLDAFKKNPIGTGPFKVDDIQPQVKMSVVRNGDYFWGDLPYMDGVTFTMLRGEAVIAGFRTGNLDATNFNSNEMKPDRVARITEATGFIAQRVGQGPALIVLNQREPFTNPLVRKAFHLAIDRKAMVDIWRGGVGSFLAAPLLAPELGGQWGIPEPELAGQPGYRADKSADLARAKELILESGIDPSSFTLEVLGGSSWPEWGPIVDQTVRDLGFKTNLSALSGSENKVRVRGGDFDVYLITASISFDDPSNYLSVWVASGSSNNYGKWADDRIDELLVDQDKVLDVAARKQMLLELQRRIIDTHFGAYIPAIIRLANIGHQPWVKNYYTNVAFNHSPIFRWEQVWLDKA
jgi:peptide/nickel transport system substrate-binding protein